MLEREMNHRELKVQISEIGQQAGMRNNWHIRSACAYGSAVYRVIVEIPIHNY